MIMMTPTGLNTLAYSEEGLERLAKRAEEFRDSCVSNSGDNSSPINNRCERVQGAMELRYRD